jgi:hypothetical protein
MLSNKSPRIVTFSYLKRQRTVSAAVSSPGRFCKAWIRRKKAAKSLLGKVNRKGTYQSSCDLAETRTEQFCEEVTVPKEIVANLLLAAGGKGGVTVGGGGGSSNDDLTNRDETKKKDRGRKR